MLEKQMSYGIMTPTSTTVKKGFHSAYTTVTAKPNDLSKPGAACMSNKFSSLFKCDK